MPDHTPDSKPVDDSPTSEFNDSGPTQAGRPSGYLGSTIKDRYFIEKELGRGGFGVVYLAKDQQLHARPVVIKILTQDFSQDPWTLKKFRQEIEALARMDHPGVVGALDTGDTDDGKPYLVMQYIEGVTLRSAIGAGMPLPRVANIARQMGQALSAAHDKGIWHRDLKPENIMLQKVGDSEEYVKLIDFGIAAIKDSQFSPQDSKTTRVAGSFAYMSPEQFQGKPAAESDVWAFGIIVWEMLTGKKPFSAESLFELMIQQQKGVTTRPRDVRPDLPEPAGQALLKALATDPARRYQRPKDFGDAFAHGVGSAGGSTSGATTAAGVTGAVFTQASLSRVLQPPTGRLEMAHVLFLDIVGYSTLPMDQQKDYLAELQQVVRDTDTFQAADREGELLRLPTGDGMALTFFGDPTAPVECAVEVAVALKSRPHLKLRTGVHSGPVYRVADINANLNVSGGGINMAQRVMDSGDAGHILVSDVVAGVLMQLGSWRDTLTDLGEHQVKHGVKVRVYNVVTKTAGNAAVPSKIAAGRKLVVPPKPEPSRRGLIAALGGLGVVAVGAGLYFGVIKKPTPPPPPTVKLEFEYYMLVQALKRNGEPDGTPARLPKAAAVGPNTGVRLGFSITQPGHLYILNKGPEGNLLFLRPNPGEGLNSKVAPGDDIQSPDPPHFFVPNKEQGVENIYLVWSAKPVPTLEQAASGSGGVTEHNHVTFKDPARVQELIDFIEKHYETTKEELDSKNNMTKLQATTEVLSHLIQIGHY